MNNLEITTADAVEEKAVVESVEFAEPNFFEKAKNVIESLLDKIYKIRCVCCFTSLFALFGLAFLFADSITVPDWMAALLLVAWLLGILSSLIACPFKMIGLVVKFVVGGVAIGLPFLVIGAIFGLVIALLICFFMVLFCPAVVTIRYYFKELRYKN